MIFISFYGITCQVLRKLRWPYRFPIDAKYYVCQILSIFWDLEGSSKAGLGEGGGGGGGRGREEGEM